MATKTATWNPYGVALSITATSGTVTRTSATKFTVSITASWKVYYSGNNTNYGMSATSGGVTKTISSAGSVHSSGSTTFTGTYSISGYGAQTKSITVTFKNFDSGSKSSSKSLTLSVSVPALASYTITYNANGGTGGPTSQKKYKGVALTLSTSKPTRTGYTFSSWNTAAGGTGTKYLSGGTYPATSNSNATLYAQWTANKYTINFDGNGDGVTGVPLSITKTYGSSVTLPTNIPTRTDYNFLGWANTSTATAATYVAGGTYSEAITANTTLYAVWELAYIKPTISNLNVYRCDSSGNLKEFDGTYVSVSFGYSCDQNVVETNSISSIVIEWKPKSDASYSTDNKVTLTPSETIGMVTNEIVGAGGINTEKAYTIRVTVTDTYGGSSVRTSDIAGAIYPLDFLAGGKGVAIGRPATIEGFDVQYQAIIRPNIDVNMDGQSGSLIVGEPTFAHMAFDANEIQAKANGTTAEWLYLNKSGGGLWFGSDGSRIHIPQDAQFGWVVTDDNGVETAWHSLLNLNSSGGNTLLGYDHFANKSGETSIYGHGINIFTNENYIYGNKPFLQQFFTVNAGDDTAVSLSTTNKVIPCTSNAVGTLSGFMTADDNGIVFSKTGYVLIFGSVYCSGLAANDVVFASLYRYRETSSGETSSTQYPGARAGATISTTSVHVPATIISVKADDIVRIAACNLTAARGSAGANTAVKMTAIYLS